MFLPTTKDQITALNLFTAKNDLREASAASCNVFNEVCYQVNKHKLTKQKREKKKILKKGFSKFHYSNNPSLKI